MKKLAKSVNEMTPGETAVVSGIVENQLSGKLLEMGFVPGALVSFNFKAPLGDPICVHISGCDLALRRKEAAMISLCDER